MKCDRWFLSAAAILMAVAVSAADKKVVYYKDFGAKGDGKTNDLPAIAKAHEYANQHKLPVKADDQAVYLLEDGTAPVVIKTDVDWGKAKFIVNDLAELKYFNRALFSVQTSLPSYKINSLKPFKRGQTNVGMKFPSRMVIKVFDETTRQYIRYGGNANKGSFQADSILVDKNGNIDQATPVNWDFKKMTKILAYPVDEKLLTVKGGEFTTYTNNRKGRHRYYSRGISVQRSNTLIKGVVHKVVEPKGIDSWPYTGFFSVGNCAEVTYKDCVVTGRKVYSYPIPGQTKRKTTGTYDISATHALKISYINVVQYNDFMDPVYWGVMGTNFCKSLLLDGCKISRFDAHQGVTNAVIRNCRMGYQGINAIGFGTFLIENTVTHANHFVNFRSDYGAMWRGDFILRNCKMIPKADRYVNIFYGRATPKHDFGYPCMLPETITLENVEIDASSLTGPRNVRIFCDFDPKNDNAKAEKPFTFTKTLNIKNFKCNRPVALARNPEQFKNMKINGKLPK